VKSGVHKNFIYKNLRGLDKSHLLCKTKFFLHYSLLS
jgi:hypothetical protein